jgi:hypothetical protein
MTTIRLTKTRMIGLTVLVVMSTISCVGSSICTGEDESGQQNVALGKRYTLTPEPNYSLCTEDGGAKQLTDGNKVDTSKQQFWINRGCVGWKTLSPVDVVIDLEQTLSRLWRIPNHAVLDVVSRSCLVSSRVE